MTSSNTTPTVASVEAGALKERPILFSGAMVRAILDGQKTQTRRVVKGALDHPDAEANMIRGEAHFGVRGPGTFHFTHGEEGDLPAIRCPYGSPGDRLWVRETWGMNHFVYEHGPIPKSRPLELTPQYMAYRATEDDTEINNELRWWPSIHMPRWASRLLLEIVSVRVERLHAITEDDALAEGVRESSLGDGLTFIGPNGGGKIPRSAAPPLLLWEFLWRGINGDASWDTNPFVWVVEFKALSQPVGGEG